MLVLIFYNNEIKIGNSILEYRFTGISLFVFRHLISL